MVCLLWSASAGFDQSPVCDFIHHTEIGRDLASGVREKRNGATSLIGLSGAKT